MDDLVKEYMNTGKDLNSILNDRIKSNNKSWILIISLFLIIFIGYFIVQNQKNVSQEKTIELKQNQLDSLLKLKTAANL